MKKPSLLMAFFCLKTTIPVNRGSVYGNRALREDRFDAKNHSGFAALKGSTKPRGSTYYFLILANNNQAYG